MKTSINRKRNLSNLFSASTSRSIIGLFFIVYLVVGVFIYKDYGVYEDEWFRRTHGRVVYEYVFEKNHELFNRSFNHPGPIFEVFLYSVEKLFNLSAFPDKIIHARHLSVFLIFYLGVIAFYYLCLRRFKDWRIALLGCLFLIISPRIFAHSFFNSKDAVFMSVFIMSIATYFKCMEKRSRWTIFLHSLVCGVLINIRIVGFHVPLFTIIFGMLSGKEKVSFRQRLHLIIWHVSCLICFVIAFWPVLWHDPFGEFLRSFVFVTTTTWMGDIYYLGQVHQAVRLPWHYIPVWIAISTPIVYLMLFVLGIVSSLRQCCRSKKRIKPDDLLIYCWFFLPVIGVMVFQVDIHGGWRHLFFIYPAFLMIALIGLTTFWQYLKRNFTDWRGWVMRGGIIFFIVINLAFTISFMIRNHPHQNVYFNYFGREAIKDEKKRFELDYWGLSYKKGIEYLLQSKPGEKIAISVATFSGYLNTLILSENDRKRIYFCKNNSQYYLTHYAYKPENEYLNLGEEDYTIEVDGVKILGIFKLPDSYIPFDEKRTCTNNVLEIVE